MSSPTFSQIDTLTNNWYTSDVCRTTCIGNTACTGIFISQNNAVHNCQASVIDGSQCNRCRTLRTTGVITSTAASNTGYKCYARRGNERREHAVLVAQPTGGSYAYNTAYDFRVKPQNPTDGGAFAEAQTWERVTCAAPTYRPGIVPSVAVAELLDRRLFITWGTPPTHGQTIGSYMYQICLCQLASLSS